MDVIIDKTPYNSVIEGGDLKSYTMRLSRQPVETVGIEVSVTATRLHSLVPLDEGTHQLSIWNPEDGPIRLKNHSTFHSN